ncbi:MAG TPA: ribosome biogenesis GTPase Der [SAR202 cluster bacterium]|nr:ribosome biogenesis GTPase Der [SAR202 cluster bacterium]
MSKPVVAIVGRPNVGKSTLFNRLVGRSVAIVSKMAGTTRDRVTTETEWGEHLFILVDTGGLEIFPETAIWRQVRIQIETAIEDADVIVMMVDVTQGVTPDDIDVAAQLRPSGRKIVLAANKADTEARGASVAEFYELGLGDPYPVSAYHNIGLDDVMAEVIKSFPDETAFPEQEADLRLAIVGRPNVGKSMMLNAITGEERSIVSDVPGTTRDTVDTLITHNDRSILLIDTAGIRRRGKIGTGVEKYSVVRAIRAIDRSDVAVLLLDASEIATAQDTHVASQILDSFKGIVLAVNKWDLASDLGVTRDDATALVRDRFKFASFAPIRFTSSMTGMGLTDLLDTTLSVYGQWTKGLPRYDLRRTVMNAIAEHPPVAHKGRSVKIYSVAQEQTAPPSFTFYVNKADTVHFSYQRYLENRLREAYDFRGSPLKMRFKSRGER